jgi:hypothetical protein
LHKDGGHKRSSGREEKQSDKGEHAGDGSTKTSTASQEGAEKGENLEEQGNQEEDPAEAPHVEVVRARGTTGVLADDLLGSVPRTSIPSLAEGGRGTCATAVGVAFTTEVEVGPLGDVAGTCDAGGVGLEEVGLVERCGVAQTGEDGEEEENEGAGDEDEGSDCQRSVWRRWLAMIEVVMVSLDDVSSA